MAIIIRFQKEYQSKARSLHQAKITKILMSCRCFTVHLKIVWDPQKGTLIVSEKKKLENFGWKNENIHLKLFRKFFGKYPATYQKALKTEMIIAGFSIAANKIQSMGFKISKQIKIGNLESPKKLYVALGEFKTDFIWTNRKVRSYRQYHHSRRGLRSNELL